MSHHSPDRIAHLFHANIEQLSAQERRVLERLTQRRQVSRDTNQDFEAGLTFGQRLADRVAAFGGSWTFILLFGSVLVGWILLNSFVLARFNDTFDPYPYILLNLILSMLAAIQAPLILMSQNRQAAKDRLDAAHDYEVNLKAELEILSLHEKIDHLREHQWAELVAMQQEQIRLLMQLVAEQQERNSPSQATEERS